MHFPQCDRSLKVHERGGITKSGSGAGCEPIHTIEELGNIVVDIIRVVKRNGIPTLSWFELVRVAGD